MSGDRSATAIDRKLGKRLRERRLALGVSQEHLAGMLGITFQQVQKYEKGTNRIAASRLFAIAAALDVTPATFIEGLYSDGAGSGKPEPPASMSTSGADELFKHFVRIRSPEVRRRVIDLVRAMRDEA